MKKTFLLMSALVLLSGCYSATVFVKKEFQPRLSNKRLMVAVVDFQNQTGDAANDAVAKNLAGTLTAALEDTEQFRMVERQRMDSIMAEMRLGAMGVISQDTAKEIGKMLGVEAIIIGNLSSVKQTHSKPTIGIMYTEGRKTEVSANARLVRVETGEILASADASAFVKERSWVAFWFAKLGTINDARTAVQTCTDTDARQLAQTLAARTYNK